MGSNFRNQSECVNGVCWELNRGRCEVPGKKTNPADHEPVLKLAKRVEPLQRNQIPWLNTEFGEASTDPPYCHQSQYAGESYDGIWFESYQTRHLLGIHAARETFNCAESTVPFNSSELVQQHQVHREVTYPRSWCKITYRHSLHQHNHHHRAHNMQKPYECPECNRHFVSPSSMNQHRRTVHYWQKPYPCTECSAHFSSASRLWQHQRKIHKFVKRYNCPYCIETFTHILQFNKHWRAHTGEVRYECTECGKTFKTETNLSKHQGIHRGEKPYKCTQCDAHYAKKADLKRHRKSH